jgi:hypothetical protein
MLKIFYNATDHSLKFENYINQPVTLTVSDSDFIYIGYKKPINALYVSMTTVSTGTRSIDLEYYNGSAYAAITSVVDRTQGFTLNGFISWDRNLTNEAVTTVQSVELYWYRLSVTTSTSATVFQGINLLLSDDVAIQEDEPQLISSDFYPLGMTSFVGFHQAARNDLIQRLRNKGKGTYNGSVFSDLTVFDLLDYTQLSVAAKFLAIAKIYFNLSDAVDDKYFQKYLEYSKASDDAFNLFFLSIDLNGDGKQTEVEKAAYETGIIIRA